MPCTAKISWKAIPFALLLGACMISLPLHSEEPPMTYPEECPYYVAHMLAGELQVKEDPHSREWKVYEFTSRSFGFAYDISTDGTRIAYSATTRVDNRLLESVEVEELLPHTVHSLKGFEAQSVRFSPSGDQIAFLGAERPPGQEGLRKGLFVWSWKTNALRHITSDVKPQAWGTRPCPISWIGEDRIVIESASQEVVSLSADGNGKRVVLVKGSDPSLSPDASALTYKHDGKMWMRDMPTEKEEALYAVSEVDNGLVWSADSRYIAYTRDMGKTVPKNEWGLFILDRKDNKEYMLAPVTRWSKYICLIDKKALSNFVPVDPKEHQR